MCGASGGTGVTRMPPRSPASAAHVVSAMASSTSLRKTWAIPARRCGYSAHQSASHRLCALIPARRSSYCSGVGGRVITTPVGKNGGTVLG